MLPSVGVLRPDDLAIAVLGCGEAAASERCPDDPLHGFARALEAVGAGDAIDQDIEIDRAFDLDDMVNHIAEIAAVADVVEAVAIGCSDDAGIGLRVGARNRGRVRLMGSGPRA